MNNNKTKVSAVEDKLKATNKIVGLRLNVNQENKKYAYVFVKLGLQLANSLFIFRIDVI